MAGLENSSILNLNPHLNITSLKSSQVDVFSNCVLFFSVLFGSSTHIYVLWLIVRGKGIALAFLNFNISICEMIIYMAVLISFLAIRFPEVYPFTAFTRGFYITGRPLFQSLICVERYLAVVHPVTFLKYKPLRYRLFCSASVWFMTLSSCLFCMFTAFDHINVYMCYFLLQFLLLLLVNLFCCVSVLWALKKSGPGERGKEKKEENHMKRRAFYLIIITTVTVFIMFVSVIIEAFFFMILSQEITHLSHLSFLCFNLAGFVQPVLYLHRIGKLSFLYCS